MTPIITLAEAKLFCRIDQDEEDGLLQIMIDAATEAAMSIADGWDGTTPVPARLKLAVLNHVGFSYDNREDGAGAPAGSSRLLMPLRRMDV